MGKKVEARAKKTIFEKANVPAAQGRIIVNPRLSATAPYKRGASGTQLVG